jgi:glutamine amidotransferase
MYVMSAKISVGIIDTGVSNAFNVVSALRSLDADVKIISDSGETNRYDRLVIPGVGSYSSAMLHLRKKGLCPDMLDFASSGKPILGICLGMQLFMDRGFENGNTSGLRMVSGTVIPISSLLTEEQNKRVPHVGWSKVHGPDDQETINGIGEGPAAKDFYFAHSYTVAIDDSNDGIRTGVVNYGGLQLVAAFQKENILGVQFHPELSGPNGLQFLGDFLSGKYMS